MPSKSQKQHNFMAAAAHNQEFAKSAGVPVRVAREYVEHDAGGRFDRGKTRRIAEALAKRRR